MIDAYWVPVLTVIQAAFTGGSAYLIAFTYRRGSAGYSLLISSCAAGMACCLGMQWLSLTAPLLWYGVWPPAVSLNNTLFFGIVFILLSRSRGNVSKMFDFRSNENGGDGN